MAAVIFGATLEPRPRGTEAEFGSGCLGGHRRIGVSQRCEAELDDLLGALADLTLNAQTHVESRVLLLLSRLVLTWLRYLNLRG